MASSKDRQRKMARAKLDRQMARRAASVRRKRQIRAGIGAGLAVLLVALGSVWLFGGFDRDPNEAAAQDLCTWTPQDATANVNLQDVGLPATKGLPAEGTQPMTVSTDSGDISVALDVGAAPCGVASLAHLAGKGYYSDSTCHELTERFLRCGDASGTGQGGPTYSLFGENVPAAPEPTPSASPGGATPAPDTGEPQYPRGTVALMAGTPGNFGSQFVIFHEDMFTNEPAYSIIGSVNGGLDVLDKIVKAGTVDNGSGAKVKPAKEVKVKTVTVGSAGGGATPEPTPPPTATPSAPAQS